MTLKLFALRNSVTKQRVPDEFFSNKPAARVRRDELNQGLKTPLYVVSVGPDHRRFKS